MMIPIGKNVSPEPDAANSHELDFSELEKKIQEVMRTRNISGVQESEENHCIAGNSEYVRTHFRTSGSKSEGDLGRVHSVCGRRFHPVCSLLIQEDGKIQSGKEEFSDLLRLHQKFPSDFRLQSSRSSHLRSSSSTKQ